MYEKFTKDELKEERIKLQQEIKSLVSNLVVIGRKSLSELNVKLKEVEQELDKRK